MPKEIIFKVKTEGTEKAAKDLEKVGDAAASSSEGVDDMGGSLEDLGGPLGNAISGVKGLGAQFKKLLANPVVAAIAGIAAVLGILFAAFSRTEKGSNKLHKGMNRLKAVFAAFMKLIEPIADFIATKITLSFDELGKKVELAAIGLQTILKLFGKINGQDTSGAVNGIKKLVEETKELTDKSDRLSNLEADLIIKRRKMGLIQKQALIDAEKLRQVRDDDSLSIEKRIEASEELAAVLAKQSKDELAIANLAKEAALLNLDIQGETPDALDRVAEAELEILDIKERINGQLSEQKVNVNSLNRESIELSKNAAEQNKIQTDAEIAALKEIQRIKQEIIDEELRIQDEQFTLQEEFRQFKLEKLKKEKEEAIDDFVVELEKKAAIANGNAELEIELEIWKTKRTAEIDAEFAQKKDKIKEKELNDIEKIKSAKQTAIFSTAEMASQALKDLASSSEHGIALQKTAAVADIAIGVARGFINGLTIAQESAAATGPGAVFAMPIFYASQIAAVLAAANKARGILTGVKGGGTAPSPSPPSPPSISTPSSSTPDVDSLLNVPGNGPNSDNQGNEAGINQQGGNNIMVSVVEINDVQNKISVIEEGAFF